MNVTAGRCVLALTRFLAPAAPIALLLLVAGALPLETSTGAAAESAPPAAGAPGRELPDRRGQSSRTYETDGGYTVTRLFSGSVNYKDAGGDWQPIDNTLVPAPGGVRNRANGYRAELPAGASAPVRFEHDGAFVSFALEGARGAAEVAGAKARYPNALPGVDLALEAQSDQLKETLTLASKAAPSIFTYALERSPGLEASENRHGGIDIRDQSGDLRFSFLPPWMADASGEAGGFSRDVSLSLRGTGADQAVVLRAERDWLDDPDRVFPVTIDPTVSYPANGSTRFSGAHQECTIASGAQAGTSLCGGPTLQVGYDGSVARRALLKFDTTAEIPDTANVLAATVGVHVESRAGVADISLAAHGLTRAWTAQASWNSTGTAAWTTPGGDFDAAASDSELVASYGVPDWYLFDGLKPLVEGWINRSRPNEGVLLKAASESGSSNTFTLSSTQSTSAPHLDVWYQQRQGEQPYWTYESMALSDRMSLRVNVASGNLLLGANDLAIAGTGLGLSLDRTYNSMEKRTWDLSQGWEMNFGRGVCFRTLPNGTIELDTPGGGQLPFVKKSDGTYQSPPGIDATFEKGAFGTRLRYHGSDLKLYFNGTTAGGLTLIEDRNGNRIDPTHTPEGVLSQITDTQGRITRFTANAQQKITGVTDPSNRQLSYGYDGSARLTSFTDAAGKITRYEYDAAGLLKAVVDPRSKRTELFYDSQRRVTKIVRVTTTGTPNTGPTWLFAYDRPARKTTVTDPNSKTTTYVYDPGGRVTETTDALGRKASTGYTSNGFVNMFESLSGTASAAASSYTYDSQTNNLTGGEAPKSAGASKGASIALAYGHAAQPHQPSSYKNAQGSSQFYGYDAAGNLTDVKDRETNPLNQATLAYYTGSDGAKKGLLKSATDGRGNATTYGYDAPGNLTRVTPPPKAGGGVLIGETTFTYDALSRVRTERDGRGVTKTFSYDPIDRVTKIDYSDGSASDCLTYDENGNQTRRAEGATCGANVTTYVYDNLNRRTKETFPGTKVNDYTYDAEGNLKTLADVGGTVSYGYDAIDRLTSVGEPGAPSPIAFAYDDATRTTTTSFPNGVSEKQRSTPAGQLERIWGEKAGTLLTSFTYDYTYTDPATGQLVDGELRRSVTDKDGSKTTYTYDDPVDRLRQAETRSSAGTLIDNFRYDYDAAGNRSKQTRNGAVTSYAYDEANRLCWSAPADIASPVCASPPTGAAQPSYDLAGQELTNGTGRTLRYNGKGQTVGVKETPTSTETLVGYLGANQSERTSAGAVTFQNNLLGMGVRVASTSTTYYTRGESGALLGQRTGTAREYLLSDALGSVAAVTDAAGTVTKRYSYEPFGQVRDGGGSAVSYFKFAGGYQSSGGLLHFSRRYYDPGVGRWTQPDPLDQVGDLREGNRYGYVGGDPVNSVDPSGSHGVSNYGYRHLVPLQQLDRTRYHCESNTGHCGPLNPYANKQQKPLSRPLVFGYKLFQCGTRVFKTRDPSACNDFSTDIP